MKLVSKGVIQGTRAYIKKLHRRTDEENRRTVLSLLEKDESARIIDLGCEFGNFTARLGERIGSTLLYGVDRVEMFIEKAESRGIKIIRGDLNEPLPIDDETFDVVHAGQVIEHLHKTDTFVREIHRILKRGGVHCGYDA